MTRGLAFAISSLPTALKSNVQSCFSGYLWVPQNVVPHLHLNPVNPTRFLHTKHRFGLLVVAVTVTVSATSASLETIAGTRTSSATSGKVNAGGGGGGIDSVKDDDDDDEEEGEAAEKRAVSMEDLEEAWCCSLRWKSL